MTSEMSDGAKIKSSREVEYLRKKLERVKRVDGKWSELCPAHSDQKASLRFGYGAKQGFLAYCFARCSFKQILDACDMPNEYRSVGLEIEEIYRYRHADGRPSREVLRRPGKEFLQRSWDGCGEYVWTTKGCPTLLYDLPDVVEAARVGETVWVVEG